MTEPTHPRRKSMSTNTKLGFPYLANPEECPHPDEALALSVRKTGLWYKEFDAKPMCTLCGRRWSPLAFQRFLYLRAIAELTPCSPSGPACEAPRKPRS